MTYWPWQIKENFQLLKIETHDTCARCVEQFTPLTYSLISNRNKCSHACHLTHTFFVSQCSNHHIFQHSCLCTLDRVSEERGWESFILCTPNYVMPTWKCNCIPPRHQKNKTAPTTGGTALRLFPHSHKHTPQWSFSEVRERYLADWGVCVWGCFAYLQLLIGDIIGLGLGLQFNISCSCYFWWDEKVVTQQKKTWLLNQKLAVWKHGRWQ